MTNPMECAGCGSREDLNVIQARGHISCCPERKMIPSPTPDGVIKERGEDGRPVGKAEAPIFGIHRRRLANIDAKWNAHHNLGEDEICFLIRMAEGFLRPVINATNGGEPPASIAQPPLVSGERGRESEGWVWLPRKPTPEMLEAYWHQTGESHAMRPRTEAFAARYYRAMIEAAPRPSQREG